MEVKSRKRRSGGVKLHWVEAGDGPPLVLLHGLADSHQSWRKVLPELARTRKVYALDLPGHGLSERPDAAYDLPYHARLVGQWVDYLDLDGFELVGHSFGGGVAQFLLITHAHRVGKLALVSSGGLGRAVHPALRLLALPFGPRVVQPLMGLSTKVGIKWVGRNAFTHRDRRWLAFANNFPGTARSIVRTARGVIGFSGQVVHFLDHAHKIGDLPPIRLFWGDRDPVVPWKHGLEALDFLDKVELVRFDGVGHFPHLGAPERFTRELLAFLDDPRVEPAVLQGFHRHGEGRSA